MSGRYPCRPQELYDREEVFGRDVGSVFQAKAPNKKDAANGSADNAEGQKDAAFASKRFITESEVCRS